MAKYSRQLVDYWANYILERGAITYTDERTPLDQVRREIGQDWREMPDRFFKRLPTKYARQKVYQRVAEKVGDFRQLASNPEKLKAKKRRRLEKQEDKLRDRSDDAQQIGERRFNLPRRPRGTGSVGIIPITTYSRKDLDNAALQVQQGRAAGVRLRIGTHVETYEADRLDELNRVQSEIYQAVKARAAGEKGWMQKVSNPAIRKALATALQPLLQNTYAVEWEIDLPTDPADYIDITANF